MDLVDEEDRTLVFLELCQHHLETFLEIAPILGTGDQRAHVQLVDRAVTQHVRHVALVDLAGEPLGQRGLADAGVTLEAADDEVDDLVSGFYATVGRLSDEIGLETAIALSRVGRFMERIADHAVNVGENITYIVTAHFPGDTHSSLAEEYE